MKQKKPGYFPVPRKRKLLAHLLRSGQLLLWPLARLGNFADMIINYWCQLQFRLTCPIHPDDIFIATYPKSGTTWMQMILYQLTTDGNMRFKHIGQKSPFWDELMQKGNPPSALFIHPRFFKTHLPYKAMPKYPCKYIYIVRDCRDVAVSFYYHYLYFMDFNGNFDHFFNKIFLKGGYIGNCNWFKHINGWYRNPLKLNILYLKYEDMKKDLPGVIRQVIKFCGFHVNEAQLQRVVERSRFSFMKQHEEKFDPIIESQLTRGINVNSGQFIRKGEVGGWRNYLKKKHLEECSKLYRQWIAGKVNLQYDL
jgi:hypothetical protein